MTPEFSRPIEAETISESGRLHDIEADETERRRLAGRFRLLKLDRLGGSFKVQRRAGIIHADGTIAADVVQACVVTGEPLAVAIQAPVQVRYVADIVEGDEVELSDEDCDTLSIEGGRIDVGELAAETLALALDPYPRSPQADDAMRELAAARTEEPGPFAVLKDLKSRLRD